MIIAGAYGYAWLKNRQTEADPRQSLFAKGGVPSPLPSGFHKGLVTGYTGAWQGKKFTPDSETGINIYHENGRPLERYPFKTRVADGLAEPKMQVYRIDYNQAGNPFWLRFIVDELVESGPGNYVGKIHLSLLPGLHFAIGWFELEK